MAKNAGKIAQLKESVSKFNADMDELRKKKGKKDDELMDDEEYCNLDRQAKELSQKIAELEAEDKAEDTKELSELRAKVKAAEEREAKDAQERKDLSERLARIEKNERDIRIGERVNACRVPAFRERLKALYAYAIEHSDASVKVYTTKDGKTESEDKPLTAVIDEMVSDINSQAEKLFKATGKTINTREEGVDIEDAADASLEVDKRVREYRVKNPEVKSYEAAANAVLAADPDLKARYSAALSRTTTH